MPNAAVNDQLSTSNSFQFTLIGHIESADGVRYLVCRDKTSFRLKEMPNDVPQGIASWQVIPSTDSTGVCTSLAIESYSDVDTSGELSEKCFLLGRVVQLGKRSQFVQFKVSRPGKKTLKISLLSPDPRMKMGTLWQVVAIRQGDALVIQQANPILDSVPSSSSSKEELNGAVTLTPSPSKGMTPTAITNGKARVDSQPAPTPSLDHQSPQQPQSDASQSAAAPVEQEESPKCLIEENKQHLPTPAPSSLSDRQTLQASIPTEAAIAALTQATQSSNWDLGMPRQRGKNGWEWEAAHCITQQRARVKVFGRNHRTQVYLYPPPCTTDSIEDLTPLDSFPEDTAEDHLSVTPLGAALGIGASCFRVLIGPYEIVMDCGTRPKGYDPLPALEHLENPDLLIISHAHQDHLGAVPVFHSRYPGTRMICTPGTREIAHIMLQDCLNVQQRSEDSPELFDETDLERTLFRLETQLIGIDFEPLPGLKVRFIHAGHILGAACIYLRYGSRSLLYTGDYNTTSSRTTNGLQLGDLPTADVLITESTYGSDVHPARKTQETALMEAIAEVIQAGGNVLIPAFALGRAQEIILAIRTFHLFHKLKIPIYVDGLVRAVTDVFRDNLELLPASVQNFVKQNGQEPFFNPTGTPPIIPIASPRERPLAMAHPSVIIASSGMLTGGPSVYYASVLLERDNAAVFISGYTDEESPGRLLQNLQTGDTIELDGKQVTVKAQVRRFNLSAHADKVGLGQVINRVNPKHLILIHGSTKALHDLSSSGDLRSKAYIHIPSVGDKVEFGQAPEHLSAMQITKIAQPQEFEVVVEAEFEGAWLRIPEDVVESDPRWQMLAKSGILRAKWDGLNLKLSPITSQNVARQKAIQMAIASGEDCCAVCQFFTPGSCQCEDSPLFSLQVDPAGKCTEFNRS